MRRKPVALLALSLSLAWVAQGGAQGLPSELRKLQAQLPAALREQLATRAAALHAMTPSERRVFEHRVRQWDALGDHERAQRRDRWQAWQQLPPGERARIRQAASDFDALPVEERQRLREVYAQLPTDQRRGWLLGPTLGADYVNLAPLISQVPVEQREPLIAVLRSMSAQQRVDLGVLARRIPPQQREQLRAELLKTTPASRSDWLYTWLDR